MAELTLTQQLRAAHVKRWQIVRVAREQNIAEHMYNVRIIALAIARAIHVGLNDTNLVSEWALIHDLPEVVTGDINTPIKMAMREAIPHECPIRRVELSLSNSYSMLYSTLKQEKPYILDIVKLADLLEAANFLTEEGIGDHARQVREGIIANYREQYARCAAAYPQFIWSGIIDNVLPDLYIPAY